MSAGLRLARRSFIPAEPPTGLRGWTGQTGAGPGRGIREVAGGGGDGLEGRRREVTGGWLPSLRAVGGWGTQRGGGAAPPAPTQAVLQTKE